jgi:tetratricopeptide (TPR) repeat protein
MKKFLVLYFVVLCIASVSCKKKSNTEILNEEFQLAQNASVNTEIKKLKESLTTAKDDSERAKIHTNIASIESEKGDSLSSIKSSQEAIKFKPNDYMSHYLLGKAYIDSGRINDAIIELQTAIGLNDKHAQSHFELGNAFYKKKLNAQAAAEYRLSVSLDNNLFMAHNNLGVLYSLMGRAAEAENELKIVVQLKPDYATVYKNLGILYDTKLGRKQEAAANYKKYLELMPNAPDRKYVKTWISVIGG